VKQPLTPCFTRRSLTFLRGLKKNNDRAWFAEHRDEYEREVRGPMVALVERMAGELPRFAPDLVASPRLSLYRIYRDTRFTDDKSPFKTQVGALFPHRDLPRHQGAGFYLEIGPAGSMIAGGIYMPQPADVQALREHIAANHARFRSLVEAPALTRSLGRITGDTLKRIPRGFAADHPAAEYLKLRQFLFVRHYPAAFATDKTFFREAVTGFERMAPVIHFLNEPLVAHLTRRDPLLRRP
jgi:uncharacterized protein (TIGR02453 family)